MKASDLLTLISEDIKDTLISLQKELKKLRDKERKHDNSHDIRVLDVQKKIARIRSKIQQEKERVQ